jgi:hypothetical protein
VSRRCEDVDDDRSIRTGVDLVWGVRRYPPGVSGAELAYLFVDPKRDRSAEHDSELLVLVAVLLDDASCIQLADGERAPLPAHDPPEHPVPDAERRD